MFPTNFALLHILPLKKGEAHVIFGGCLLIYSKCKKFTNICIETYILVITR